MSSVFERWSRHDADFDQRVHGPLYNRLPVPRMPVALSRPTTPAQVVEAVREARQSSQRIALRSGGNSWIGASVRDGGCLLDLGALDHIRVDASARRAWVGPGARSRDLVRALAAEGLAFPVGHCGAPAMGGYLLGGGLGFNWGTWQPACFSVTALQVVTADGRCLRADERDHSDLLWMARGSGPGFPGVVTEFELALQPLPRDVRLSVWHFPLDTLGAVTDWVTRASAGLGADVEIAVTTIGPDRTALPPGPGMPEGLVQVAAIAYADDEHQARTALLPLDALPAPRALTYEPLLAVPFEQLDLGAEAAHPPGHRVLSDTFWTDRDVHAVLPALEPLLQRAPSGKNSVVALMPAHGASRAGVPRGPGAYSMDHKTLVLAYATWLDAADDARNQAWMNEVISALEPISDGHFLSEADLLRHAGRAQRCFGAAEWQRLEVLRRQWDPDGLFHGFPGPAS